MIDWLNWREQAVRGTVRVNLKSGKRVEHLGIKVEMIGQIGALAGVNA